MRSLVMGLTVLILGSTACRKRSEIPLELPTWDTHESSDATEGEPSASEMAAPNDAPEALPDVSKTMSPPAAPAQAEAPKKTSVALLKFAHTGNLCMEAGTDGTISLQTCAPDVEAQKFQAVPALDGRMQYQNIKSKLCLASGGDRFQGFVVAMEGCTSKESQFFTKVPFDTLYALRQDAANRCLYAENGSKAPGARVVMFPCANDMAQRLVP